MANNIQLDIKVNADTGQLEVMGAKFEGLGQKADKAQGSFKQLSGEAGNLLKSAIGFAGAAGVAAFFVNAVKGAEEENESLRRLKFTLESTGQSWEKSKGDIEKWSQAIQETTRFSDGEALQSLDKLARSTKTVAQAQSASQLAMNLSVASGKDLASSTLLINDLINNQERAVVQARKEFGNFAGDATTTQGVLDNLANAVKGASEKEEGLTKSTNQMKNTWGEFSDQIGNTFMPVAVATVNILKGLVGWIDKIGTSLAGLVAMWVEGWKGMANIVKAALQFDFSGVKAAAAETLSTLANLTTETAIMLESHEQVKTDILKKGSEERIQVSDALTKEQLAKQQEAAEKLEQIAQDLDQKTIAIGEQTYSKKLALLNAEVKAKQAAINAQIKLGVDGQKAQDKLNEYEKTQKLALAQSEIQIKTQVALDIANLAVQTLQVVNSLGDKGSSAERTRAKALLALQQSIAIGWAWVNANKAAAGPFATALAVAQTALIVAQFAQQSKNIDNAAKQESAGISAINVRGGVPGIDLDAPLSSGGGLSSLSTISSGGSFSSSGGGGGGGGGGAIVINVGGISVNFDVEKLSVDNVDAVMMRITEKLRQETIVGIQLALRMDSLARKNANLAA